MTQSMEIQAANSPALMIQANSLDAVRSTLAAAQSATTPQQHADVILQLSIRRPATADEPRASRTPRVGTTHTQDAGSPPRVSGRRGANLLSTMSAFELHNQLLELHAERHLAEETGVANIGSYMADLERDIARSTRGLRGRGRDGDRLLPRPALGPELRLEALIGATPVGRLWPRACGGSSGPGRSRRPAPRRRTRRTRPRRARR